MTNNNENNNAEKKELTPAWHSGFSGLDNIFDNFKRDFENFLSPSLVSGKTLHPMFGSSSPVCDIVDEGDKFVVTADMPRIKKEEINLDGWHWIYSCDWNYVFGNPELN